MVKARSMEIILYDQYMDDFMSSQGVVERNASTYITRNAHVVRH